MDPFLCSKYQKTKISWLQSEFMCQVKKLKTQLTRTTHMADTHVIQNVVSIVTIVPIASQQNKQMTKLSNNVDWIIEFHSQIVVWFIYEEVWHPSVCKYGSKDFHCDDYAFHKE